MILGFHNTEALASPVTTVLIQWGIKGEVRLETLSGEGLWASYMINIFCNRVLTILEQSKVFNVLIFLCLLAKCNVRLHL